MVTINGPHDFLAHVSAGPNRQVMVSAAQGVKAANFHIRPNDEVGDNIRAMRGWLGFNDLVERQLVMAVLAERANGAA